MDLRRFGNTKFKRVSRHIHAYVYDLYNILPAKCINFILLATSISKKDRSRTVIVDGCQYPVKARERHPSWKCYAIIGPQKQIKKTCMTMRQSENPHIEYIGLEKICTVGKFHKSCLWIVQNGQKTSLDSIKNLWKVAKNKVTKDAFSKLILIIP